MIISASRRTDIPAFYSEWFMNRIREGFCYVRNPYYLNQVSKISLSPQDVDCIVFWTKDATNLIPHLEELDIKRYKYYFQFTITPYGYKEIEPNLPEKNYLISCFRKLSNIIGKEKVIWRYDPIFYSDKIDHDYHIQRITKMASDLNGFTERCVISFLDMYDSIKSTMNQLRIRQLTVDEMIKLGREMSYIIGEQNMTLATCAEHVLSSVTHVQRNKCIDDELINRIGYKYRKTEKVEHIKYKKDKNQRGDCLCASSVDIGQYGTCKHYCSYCYANREIVTEHHDACSPFLIGHSKDEDVIKERKK